jgi:hypothetical protein
MIISQPDGDIIVIDDIRKLESVSEVEFVTAWFCMVYFVC